MKLLFDQNLSYLLPRFLEEEFPDSRHVREFDLQAGRDDAIWSLAQQEGFVIATKDVDFIQLNAMHGSPPKVLHLRIGNSPTSEIASLIKTNSSLIRSWVQRADEGVLVLFR